MTANTGGNAHGTLRRHFFHGFFRLSFLDDAGEESMARAMIGVFAGILALGALLARLYAGKYAGLSQQPSADGYLAALPADQLAMIVVPMVIVAFVMALVSPSIFPDELDFRVLMALPVSRRVIFESKALAVVQFASIFIAAANVAFGLPFALISGGRWADDSLVARVAAGLAAGVGGSLFAVAAVIALQGLVVLLTPGHWKRRAIVWMQTAIVCELVLLLPGVLQVPGVAPWLAEEPPWLVLAAPAWFLGVERWLLGDCREFITRLAAAALIGTTAITLVALACYLVLYRRFDRIAFQTPLGDGAAAAGWLRMPRVPFNRSPAADAVRLFTRATLRRSGLHQLVVFAALSAGLALAVNRVLLNANEAERWLLRAGVGAPLGAIVVAVLGLRSALLLPTNLRAAWIFRFTERNDMRARQLGVVSRTLFLRGVVLPVAVLIPLQALVLGWQDTLWCVPVLLAIGWILVEVIAHDWRRIPFTCTVLFGKRPAALTVLIFFLVWGFVGVVGTTLAQVAIEGPRQWLVIMGLLAAAALGLRWRRMQMWGRLPLEFEDYLPDSLETLRL